MNRRLPMAAVGLAAWATVESARWADDRPGLFTGPWMPDLLRGLFVLAAALAAVWDVSGWLGHRSLSSSVGRTSLGVLGCALLVGAFSPFGSWFVGPLGAAMLVLALGGDRLLAPARAPGAERRAPRAAPDNVR